MKLQIENKRTPKQFAKGTDENKKEYIVIGGDLFLGETIEVELYNEEKQIYIHPKLNYDTIEIFDEYLDDDGLASFNDLNEVLEKSKPHFRVYELGDFWVFPEKKIRHLIEYSYENEIIQGSKFRISKNWKSVQGRLSVYSVNYDKLLDDVLRTKQKITSWFYCIKEKDFDKGVYADLFIMGEYKKPFLQIQLWQIIGNGEEIHYAHGLINSDKSEFNHFDLATHYINPNEIPNLIYKKERLHLINKIKWFRFDEDVENSISMKTDNVFDLLKIFFPTDYLVDEFREVKIN